MFEEQFELMGRGFYHEEYGCTIDNCLFYTFAAQSHLEDLNVLPHKRSFSLLFALSDYM